MTGFLFEQVIFGPVRSRRLGISLGVNLLPLNRKACTFNCLYCECGWTKEDAVSGLDLSGLKRDLLSHETNQGKATTGSCSGTGFPLRKVVREEMEQKLAGMASKKDMITNITFAGNGEPTIHPDFPGIVDDTIVLRDKYFPNASISVLSNASMVNTDELVNTLNKVDQNILKLDAGTNKTFHLINNPWIKFNLHEVVNNLLRFEGRLIIQTLFVKGTYKGKAFDNTTNEEIDAWLTHLKRIRPQAVMIYLIARETPIQNIEKITPETLMSIAARVEALGIPTEVYA